jgi:hypothetical protein
MTYTQGVIDIVSSTGEFASKNFINSISCGTPDISVIFKTLSCLNVQSLGHSFAQNSKFGASTEATAVDEPYIKTIDEKTKSLHQS